MSIRRVLAPAVALLLLSSGKVFAQVTPSQKSINLVHDAPTYQSTFGFNYGPPNSSALDLLGLSTDKVTSQSSLGPFLFSLPTLWDSGSGQAAALDISPLWVVSGGDQSGYYYRNYNKIFSLLARAKIDVAVTNGVSSTDISKQQLSGVAIGGSFPLLTYDDPLLSSLPGSEETYFKQCLEAEQPIVDKAMATGDTYFYEHIEDLQNLIGRINGYLNDPHASDAQKTAFISGLDGKYGTFQGPLNSQLKSLAASITKLKTSASADEDAYNKNEAQTLGLPTYFAACAKGASTLASMAPDLTFGIGARENGQAGTLAKLHGGGGSVWLSGRVPVPGLNNLNLSDPFGPLNKGEVQYLMLGGSLRYDDNARFTTGNTKRPVISANNFNVWGGLEWYGSWARAGAQFGYANVRATSAADSRFNQSGSRWLASTSVKVWSTNFWVGATYGNADGTTTKLKDRTFLLTLYYSPPGPDALFGNKITSSTDSTPKTDGGS